MPRAPSVAVLSSLGSSRECAGYVIIDSLRLGLLLRMIEPALTRLTLAELAQVGAGQLPAALGALAEVQAILTARLMAPKPGTAARPTQAPDRLLRAQEAAARLGMSRRWLYAHASELPFARRVSAGAVRFSERGMERWQATRRV